MEFFRKRDWIIILVALIIIADIIYCFIDPKSPGRDTVVSLGDGTFQILKSPPSDETGKRDYSLYNVVENDTIADFIIKYKIDKKIKIIYIIGKDQLNDKGYKYTILNYKSGEYSQYNNFDEMESDLKKIFDDETQFKTLG